MPSKASSATFTEDWNKTVNWAKQNNIPYSAYYPVYQLDSQRYLSGTPMSEAARIQAIQSAAGLSYTTALPTDSTDWTHIRGNTIRNAQDIFTGLEPTHIIPNVFDTVKNTIEHPGSIFSAIGDAITGNEGAAARQILKPNNILQWVPGVYDLATVFNADPHLTGNKGFEALAQNPISAVLDVLPFGRVASEALGRVGIGATVADRLGLTTEELRKAGIWRVGGKLIKTVPVPSLLTRVDHPWLNYQMDPDTGLLTPVTVKGKMVKQQPTMGDRWEQLKRKAGASSDQADITESTLHINDEGTAIVENIVGPALRALDKLSIDQKQALTAWVRSDLRSFSEKMEDARVPLAIRNAYAEAYQWGQKYKELKMQAGEAEEVVTPWKDQNGQPVTELYFVNTDEYKAVSRDLNQANKDQQNLDEFAEPFDATLYKIDENDRNMIGVFQAMDQQSTAIFEAIKRQIPQAQDAGVADAMRETLPEGERWDRAVSQQTPLLRNLLGLPPTIGAEAKRLFPDVVEKNLTRQMVNNVRDLFAPGGLLRQASQAYRDEDWDHLEQITKAADRKFKAGTFKDVPKDGPIYTLMRINENLLRYARTRKKMVKILTKQTEQLGRLSTKAAKSHQQWLKTAIHNPPSVWRDMGVDIVTQQVAQEERTAAGIEDTTKVLSAQGWDSSLLTKQRRDNRTILELMSSSAKASLENNMLPDIDHAESIRVTEDMYQQLASLRARGQEPMYVPTVSAYDIEHGEPTYDVHIRGVKSPRQSSSFSKVWGYTPSIYDLGVGMLKATKEMVEKDMMDKFVNQELIPRLSPAADIQATIRTYYSAEIQELDRQTAMGKPRTESALTIMERGLNNFNLVQFNKDQFFGEGFAHPSLNGEYFIDKDLAKAFKSTIERFQFPAQNFVDRGTKLFRFSILSLSPRYTAHILLGGTFLVGLRGNPGMFRFLPEAVHFAMHNSFNEKTLSRFPELDMEAVGRQLGGETTQEGAAQATYHYATMKGMGRNILVPAWMDKHLLNDTYQNRIIAAANLNTTFTRAIVKAQKAVVYLDAAAKASKDGKMFYDDDLVPRTDEQGNPIMHPVTGRQMHDTVRSKVPMTAKEVNKLGMEAVADVMGNLRHMTPLERNVLVRVFPFYGWTKHVLQYVMSYPFDHPWRAMILGNIAMQNSEDVASGLPLRIELLTFLGTPDQYGNVTAIDTKALNPLRDTANYASMTGLFESLNPAITAFGSLVDPQLPFAGQSLYPNVTFNTLYGIKQATTPPGNVFSAAEQFVPQLSALDEAFNISGQYSYLSKSDPSAFSKKVFESLGLPLTPQSLNLRQMAATEELDRFNIAQNDAYHAATTGDLSTIEQYPAGSLLPYPLNPKYSVTPAYIEALTNESEQTTGLPFYETVTPPPSPQV